MRHDLSAPAPGARSIAAASFRQTRQRLAYVRQQAQALAPLRGFRREVAARTWEQQWCETRCQLPGPNLAKLQIVANETRRAPQQS